MLLKSLTLTKIPFIILQRFSLIDGYNKLLSISFSFIYFFSFVLPFKYATCGLTISDIENFRKAMQNKQISERRIKKFLLS